MPACPSGSFADPTNLRCMDVCSGVQFSYSSGGSRICLFLCPNGTYGSKATKSCVPLCPNQTFGENSTWTCVGRCPAGSYADSKLNMCVLSCSLVFS